ncbi:AMP-binding protein, partial [Pseudoalteromonas sp. P1-9]|uniref:AMP-binding protein n=1 Tax=Pseudoalteromonas sp. P1-9 TaxID=1710354 RepID=UPI00128FB71D
VYQSLLADLAASHQSRSLLPEYEVRYLTEVLNQTDKAYNRQPLISQFIQQAKATPDAIALRCQEETLTYQALASQAERLAHYLNEMGVGVGDRVGIGLPR